MRNFINCAPSQNIIKRCTEGDREAGNDVRTGKPRNAFCPEVHKERCHCEDLNLDIYVNINDDDVEIAFSCGLDSPEDSDPQ
jgi:hypothetical protein